MVKKILEVPGKNSSEHVQCALGKTKMTIDLLLFGYKALKAIDAAIQKEVLGYFQLKGMLNSKFDIFEIWPVSVQNAGQLPGRGSSGKMALSSRSFAGVETCVMLRAS